MKKLSITKQILVISYSILAIVFGLLLSIEHDAFGFLVPIALTNMFSFYFVCKMEDGINWKGLCIYFASLFLSFTILFSMPSPSYIDEVRLACINQLSVMYTIMGMLAGGIARYKVERYEKKKKEDDNE